MKKSVKVLALSLMCAVGVTMVGGSSVSAVKEYTYDLPSCAANETFYTGIQRKYTNTNMVSNRLYKNTSNYCLYFMVAKCDNWEQATNARWQCSGTTYDYDYYSGYAKKAFDTRLCLRRDTRDTYSGTRYVYGAWGNASR